MRAEYWQSPKRSINELTLKLNEEAGEVAKGILNRDTANTLEEIRHVEQICKALRRKLKTKAKAKKARSKK